MKEIISALKSLALLVVSVLFIGSAYAQEEEKIPPPPEKREMKQERKYPPIQNLTDGQKTQLDALRKQSMEERKKIEADNSLTPEQKKSALMDLRRKSMVRQKNILTPEQLSQMKKDRVKMGANGKHFRDGKSKGINLSPEQKTQMKTLNDEFKKKEQVIKSNSLISKDAKQEQLKTLQNEKRERMDAFLAPEQKAQMQKIHNDRAMKRKGKDGASNPQ